MSPDIKLSMKKFSFVRILANMCRCWNKVEKIKFILKTKISINFKVWVPSYPPLADNVLSVAGSRFILMILYSRFLVD